MVQEIMLIKYNHPGIKYPFILNRQLIFPGLLNCINPG